MMPLRTASKLNILIKNIKAVYKFFMWNLFFIIPSPNIKVYCLLIYGSFILDQDHFVMQ